MSYKEYHDYQDFKKKNKLFLSEPIVKTFIHYYPEVEDLLKKIITLHDNEALNDLNQKFTEHFYKYRLLSYIAMLSKNFSIDFDKKQKKLKERYQLLFDEKDDKFLDLLNLAGDKNSSIDNITWSFINNIEDEKLFSAYHQLAPKERKILELLYVNQYKQNEVARMFNQTPQNINRIHKVILKKLKMNIERYPK